MVKMLELAHCRKRQRLSEQTILKDGKFQSQSDLSDFIRTSVTIYGDAKRISE
jgi:hypothetical protein